MTEFRRAVIRLIEEAGSARALAARLGCTPCHVWQARRGETRWSPSLCVRAGLPASMGSTEEHDPEKSRRAGLCNYGRAEREAELLDIEARKAEERARKAEERARWHAKPLRRPRPVVMGVAEIIREAYAREGRRRTWAIGTTARCDG